MQVNRLRLALGGITREMITVAHSSIQRVDSGSYEQYTSFTCVMCGHCWRLPDQTREAPLPCPCCKTTSALDCEQAATPYLDGVPRACLPYRLHAQPRSGTDQERNPSKSGLMQSRCCCGANPR